MKSRTAPVLFQPNGDPLIPVPPPGRTRGLNVHAVRLINLTRADQRAQRAMQISYRCRPALPSGAGRKQAYADWSILLLSLLQALWQLSQEQVVAWAASWPALAHACGFHGRVLSASQYARRLKRLGLFPYFVFFVSLVIELTSLRVIHGDDLIIDSTFLRAWSPRYGNGVVLSCGAAQRALWIQSAHASLPLVQFARLVYGAPRELAR